MGGDFPRVGPKQFETPKLDVLGPDEGSHIERRLLDLLHEVRLISDETIRTVVQDAISSSIGEFESVRRNAPRLPDTLVEAALPAFERALRISSSELQDWSTIEIAAGPWTLQLGGTALPAPQFAVTLGGADERSAAGEPFLTLVRPKQGFETAGFDASGAAKMALPEGQSLLLVQDAEVWELRLNYHVA
jgi:hypothetical protein